MSRGRDQFGEGVRAAEDLFTRMMADPDWSNQCGIGFAATFSQYLDELKLPSGVFVDGEDLMTQRWYPVEDDTIGGTALSTVDKPVREHEYHKGEVPVGNFLDRTVAEYIAKLHNKALAADPDNRTIGGKDGD